MWYSAQSNSFGFDFQPQVGIRAIIVDFECAAHQFAGVPLARWVTASGQGGFHSLVAQEQSHTLVGRPIGRERGRRLPVQGNLEHIAFCKSSLRRVGKRLAIVVVPDDRHATKFEIRPVLHRDNRHRQRIFRTVQSRLRDFNGIA